MSSNPPRRIVPPVPLDDFRPLPLLTNAHAQTVVAAYWNGAKLRNPIQTLVLPLPDGDSLMVYDSAPENWQPGDRVVVMVHGLTGWGLSPQMQRMGRKLIERGARVVSLNQRGTGAGLPLARSAYHGGRSDDVRAVLEMVHHWAPTSPIALYGTSLGGNLVLKLAGEAADRPVPGLERVAAQNPPLDMAASMHMLTQRNNRSYDQHFTRHLVEEAVRRQKHFPDLPPLRFPVRMTTRLYDELYTAPRSGFADALDYYAQCSSGPLVTRIPVPAFILTARDDPFISVEPFEAIQPPEHVQIVIMDRGGHVGFLGRDGEGGIRWAEHRLVEWLLAP